MDKDKKKAINRLIEEQGGKIVTIGAEKKDGTFRKFNCRMGVDMNNGGELKYVPDEYDLMLVFDMQKKAPRMVNLPGVKWVKASGKTTKF